MKKILSLILCSIMVLCFAGCNALNDSVTSTEKVQNLCDHIFTEATCISPAECSICGMINKGALGHAFNGQTCDDGGTCSRCGEIGSPLGHSWYDATCTDPQKCNRCGITDGNALGHSDNGNGKCSRCGEIITVDMNKRIGSPNDCEKTSGLGGFSFYKNSANGIKVLWGGKNNTGKTINYYTITFHFYNSVGDEARSEITGKATKNIKMVGPVQPGEDLIIFSIVDYVPVCSKVQIDEIKLEYSDGTVEYGWYGWYTSKQNSFLK